MKDKFLLASCASHTMHRFTRALKIRKLFKKNFKNEDGDFAIHCFLMLLNDDELCWSGNHFEDISFAVYLFVGEHCDEETETAREVLQHFEDIRKKAQEFNRSKSTPPKNPLYNPLTKTIGLCYLLPLERILSFTLIRKEKVRKQETKCLETGLHFLNPVAT